MTKIIRTFALLILLVSVLSITGGCIYLDTPPPVVETSPPPEATTPPEITTEPQPDWESPKPETPTDEVNTAIPTLAPIITTARPGVVSIFVEYNSYGTGGASGTGWVIDSGNGYVVTNYHVIEDGQKITVVLHDGREFEAKVVGSDSLSDVAVLKIQATDLEALPVGDSTTQEVGDWVLVIGNPLGLRVTATTGIISATGVFLERGNGLFTEELIQTDAAVNPGNSGGPLLNLSGEVIGITSIKWVEQGVEAFGFAIAMDAALPLIQDLIAQGYVTRPYLGVSVRAVDSFLLMRYDLAVNRGAFISYIGENSPAEAIGLQTGDVITLIEDAEVILPGDLITELQKHDIGDSVQITYWRGDTAYTVNVTLAATPPPEG
jgi:serine protease Do